MSTAAALNWSGDEPVGEPASRRDQLLGMIQKEFTGYHPLISIARIAHHGGADLKLQFECHKTIAKYVEPELKSLEVKGEITGRHRVQVSMFEESRPALEGVARRMVVSETARVLPGGSVIDTEPQVVDRVTCDW